MEARIININDKKETVATEKYPEIFEVSADDDDTARTILYDILKKRFRDG